MHYFPFWKQVFDGTELVKELSGHALRSQKSPDRPPARHTRWGQDRVSQSMAWLPRATECVHEEAL